MATHHTYNPLRPEVRFPQLVMLSSIVDYSMKSVKKLTVETVQ